jgi:hypothetical protein
MPIPQTRFRWGARSLFVDYPPGSLLVLGVAGRLYRLVRPEMPNGPLFNVAVNLAPLLGSLAAAWLLARTSPGVLGWRRALLLWLNPAVFLAAPLLGYQDTVFGCFALAAVIALMDRRYVAATALVVASGLIKPQGALLLPVLVVVALREARPRVWMQALLAGAATAAVILLPWWSQGYLLSALDGCRRPLAQTTLAPLGFNVWWIAGYAMEWSQSGSWPLAMVESIDAFRAWAAFDPRLPSRLLMAAGTAVILYLLLRRPRDDRWMIPLAVILQVHVYALFGTSVHENHTLLAVLLAPLLIGALSGAGILLAGTSAFLFGNLLFAVGFGRGITNQGMIKGWRMLLGLDLSVVVAAFHIALVAFLFVWAFRAKPESLPRGR